MKNEPTVTITHTQLVEFGSIIANDMMREMGIRKADDPNARIGYSAMLRELKRFGLGRTDLDRSINSGLIAVEKSGPHRTSKVTAAAKDWRAFLISHVEVTDHLKVS